MQLRPRLHKQGQFLQSQERFPNNKSCSNAEDLPCLGNNARLNEDRAENDKS